VLPLLFVGLAALSPLLAADETAGPALENDEQKTLYAIGLAMSRNFQTLQLTPSELQLISAGLEDGALGREPRVDLQVYGPKIETLLNSRVSAAADREKAAAASFVEEMAKQNGAEKTPSGLVFFSIEEGTGAQPGATDTVRLHYHGTLRDGSVFDSSRDKGEPVEFNLAQVVPCFGEGLQKVKVGGKAKLVCPPELGYGERGVPGLIPPGAALVFEVELLEIKAAEPAAGTSPAPTP
jgi:FKBP-type peptidyl-prolyl cis-trans isomerase